MKSRSSTSERTQLAVLENRLDNQDKVMERLTAICEQTLAQATKTNGRVNTHDLLLAEAEKNREMVARETAEHRESVAKDLNEIKVWIKASPVVGAVILLLCGLFAWLHSVGLIKF